jgi:hypothetical protein
VASKYILSFTVPDTDGLQQVSELLGPEKSRSTGGARLAKHAQGCRSTLPLRFGPVLHPDPFTAGAGYGGQVAGRKDFRLPGSETIIHGHGALFQDTCSFKILCGGTDARCDNDQLRLQAQSIGKDNLLHPSPALEASCPPTKKKAHAPVFVQLPEPAADGFAEAAVHRQRLRGHNPDRQPPAAQSGGRLQSDKPGSQDNGAAGRRQGQGNLLGIGLAAQVKTTPELLAWKVQPPGYTAAGQQQAVIGQAVSAIENQAALIRG